MFDAKTFLSASLAANSTENILIPPGLYEASIDKLDIKNGEAGPNAKNPGTPWARLDVTWEIQDANVREIIGRSKVLITQGIMLDLDQNGQLDSGKGKNVRLGKLRAAVGCNQGNEALLQMVGKMAKINVVETIFNNTPWNEVQSVVAI